MPTTTIRLEDDLKSRIAAAAARAGKTAHAFMLDAIAETVARAEEDDEFHRLADSRWEKLLADGEVLDWADVRGWLLARARGESPPRPVPRKL
jgi:predicted transcriptional regulator